MEESPNNALTKLQTFLEKNGQNMEITVLTGNKPLPESVTFRSENLAIRFSNSSHDFLVLEGNKGRVQIRLIAENLLIRDNLPYWSNGIMLGNKEDAATTILIRSIP